jgi:hypothetical protein
MHKDHLSIFRTSVKYKYTSEMILIIFKRLLNDTIPAPTDDSTKTQLGTAI